jgi:uncharacterized protein (DUF3820 family)
MQNFSSYGGGPYYPEEFDDNASLMPPLPGEDDGDHAQQDGSTILPFGKHKGKTFAEVFDSEQGYVSWVCGQSELKGLLLDFKEYCANRGVSAPAQQQQSSQPSRKRDADEASHSSSQGMITVGKHKGRSFEDVMQSEKNYTEWIARSPDLTGNLADFRVFVQNKGGVIPSPVKKATFSNNSSNNNNNNKNNSYGNKNNNNNNNNNAGTIPSGKVFLFF